MSPGPWPARITRCDRHFMACALVALSFVRWPDAAKSEARRSDPLSVIATLLEAQESGDYDLAVALFDDDSVTINVVGARFIGRDQVKEFLHGIDGLGRNRKIDGPRAASGAVTWAEALASQDYEKLEIAPVHVAKEAVIRDGKIKSLVTHFPPSSLAKFEKVCEQEGCAAPKADGVLFFGYPCIRFLARAWAQTRSIATPQ